ncbi:AfsR/SARP family transcriptional regulator [Streptomyces mirabilis]|uniref:AfsR/SARP family transcriptional regulator n=1 Tax=Streptomyces mirabilis TaxID=68239 RepID=UPI0038193200
MIDVLWGDKPPKNAANVVYRHVGALKNLLTPGFDGDSSAVIRTSGFYRIPVDSDALDLLRFRAFTEGAAQAHGAGESRTALGLLTQALDLRYGMTVANIPAQIAAHPAFTAVDREFLGVVEMAADIALKAGLTARILPALRETAELNPLEEALQARLMKALAANGHQAEALEVYRRIRFQLSDQLGVEPGPGLLSAHQQVLRQAAPVPDGSRVPAAQDTSAAPRQPLLPSARPSAPAAPRRHAPAARPAQLPAALDCFTGRHQELRRLRALVSDVVDVGRTATVTISAIDGMAGVGKTTLAVHLAHGIAHHFPDGQLYINLRGFNQGGSAVGSSEALRTFLLALGVSHQSVPNGLDEQAALYRSVLADRRMLIVLDNARDPQHVRPLLPGTADCLVIVTSRDQLHGLIAAQGALPLTLGPFSAEEAREALSRRLGAERVAAEPDAVERIIMLCGRLPLALAVLAARGATRPDWPLASIAAELCNSHGNLNAFAGTDPSTDVRTVFSWSYESLSTEAARFFRLLAVHPGPDFTVLAAANVVGLPVRQAEALLSELSRNNLLAEDSPGRYAFHDLLHAYADELNRNHDDEETRRAALRRMVDYYLHSAHSATTLIIPAPPESSSLSSPLSGTLPEVIEERRQATVWLDAELPALLSLIELADSRGFPQHSYHLAQVLDLELDRRGRWQEQLAVQQTALKASERAGDPAGQAHAHRALGFAYGRLERRSEAQNHLERALALFTESGHLEGQARTHRSSAFHANSALDHHRALRHYAAAFALYGSTENPGGQARVLNETGWTRILLGQHGRAVRLCRRAITMHQRMADRGGEAAAWDSLGYAQHHLGQYREALASYEQALTIYRAISDRSLEADTLTHIGDSLDVLGKRASAVTAWEHAVTILTELGHPDTEQIRHRIEGSPG